MHFVFGKYIYIYRERERDEVTQSIETMHGVEGVV